MREKIEERAKELGFDLVGFSPAKIEEKYIDAIKNWLKEGSHADMLYMEKIQQRCDLQTILPGAKSVIVLGMNYYKEQKALKKDHGRVARYAYGRDYHKIIKKKLKQLEQFIEELTGKSEQTKAYVDTGPVLERALAEQSGIGKFGKNACLITPEFGSWVFLSEIITTLDLSKPTIQKKDSFASWRLPAAQDFSPCRNCTKCIKACPTGAIIAPGVVDSRLCISYLTIENKGSIPPHLAKIIKKTKLLYGCDICQEVCPHNETRQKPTIHKELSDPKIAGDQLNLKKIKALKTDQEYLDIFAGSPLMRAKRAGLQRNANTLFD